MPSPAIRKDPAAAARSAAQAAASRASGTQTNQAPSAMTRTSPEDARDSAISDVSAARAQPRRSRSASWRNAAIQVGRAYENNGGSTGVHQLLRQNPDIMRAVATGPAEQMETLMKDDVGSSDGSNALRAAGEFINGAVRDNVATHAQRIIRRHIRGAEQTRTNILSNLESFQNAPAGSPEARTLSSMGLDRNASAADVNRAMDTTVQGLEALHDRFEGQRWEVGDFPNSARAVGAQMRLRSHTAERTLADGIMTETSGGDDALAAGIADFAHAGVDGYLIATGEHVVAGIVAVELSVLAGGLALGMAIHHGAEEIRNEAIARAHDLGI